MIVNDLQKVFKQIQQIVSKFVWQVKKPRIKASKLYQLINQGDLALPNTSCSEAFCNTATAVTRIKFWECWQPLDKYLNRSNRQEAFSRSLTNQQSQLATYREYFKGWLAKCSIKEANKILPYSKDKRDQEGVWGKCSLLWFKAEGWNIWQRINNKGLFGWSALN